MLHGERQLSREAWVIETFRQPQVDALKLGLAEFIGPVHGARGQQAHGQFPDDGHAAGMAHRKALQKVLVVFLVFLADVRVAGIPGVLVQVGVGYPEPGIRILQRSLDLKTLLVDGDVVVDGPVVELDDAADHVPKGILEAPDFK